MLHRRFILSLMENIPSLGRWDRNSFSGAMTVTEGLKLANSTACGGLVHRCVTLMRGTVKRSDLSYEFTNFAHKVESRHCVNVDSKDQRHQHTMCEVRLRQMKTHHFLYTFNEAPVVFRCCWSPKNRTWSAFGVHHHIVAASHALPVNYTA